MKSPGRHCRAGARTHAVVPLETRVVPAFSEEMAACLVSIGLNWDLWLRLGRV